MPVEPTSLVTLLSNPAVNLVFKEILKNRSVLFKDIRQSLSGKFDVETEHTKIEEAVQALVDASLVKERPASIEDFNTYYVTADGLTAERQLRLIEPSSRTSYL